MVTPNQLRSWRPDLVQEISDDIAANRSVLIRQSDELAAGRVPTSWTFQSAVAAQVAHQRLADALAVQVAEAATVVAALDAAATSIRAAKDALAAAYSTASLYDLSVDGTTGAVRVTRTFENSEDARWAYVTAAQLSNQIDEALTSAQNADDTLAAVLRSAATTDVNTVGTLAEQREALDFLELSPTEQADYLLEHPDSYERLSELMSPQAKEILGGRIAAELDTVSRDAQLLRDPEQVERCTELFAAFGDDPVLMAAMYAEIEPQETLALLSSVSAAMIDETTQAELVVLADEIRSSLQVATTAPGFDGEQYARDLVRCATYDIPLEDQIAFQNEYPYSNFSNASVLDYLLREGDYSDEFVRGAVWQLDEFERNDPFRASQWAYHDSMSSPLNFLDGHVYTWEEGTHPYLPDPTASAMGLLAQHPDVGLEFFTEGTDGATRSEFYFEERDWQRDGFAGIAEAGLAIGSDPENLANDPQRTAMFVSDYLDRLPENPRFTAEYAWGAAEPVGQLLRNYMPAVELATSTPDDFGAGVRTTDAEDYLPHYDHYPLLDKPDLDGLLKVALSTEEGMARVAEGVAGFRMEQLYSFADQHPDGATTDNAALQSVIDRSARLEGYMQHAVGDIAIEGAISRDQQVAAFTGFVSEAVGLIPVPGADAIGEVFGETAKEVVNIAWNHLQEIPTDTITEVWGSSEDAVRDAETGQAMLGRQNAVITTYLALTKAGLVPFDEAVMADTWMVDNPADPVPPRLITLAEIPPEQIQTYYGEASSKLGSILSPTQLELLYKDPFTDWHSK